jgi:hypothetical protein
MSNQSPSANGRDQQGPGVGDRDHDEHPPARDESGFASGVDQAANDVPPDTDIDETDDPSKD